MQSYPSPSLEQERSHSIWLSMLEEITAQKLDASTFPGVWIKLIAFSLIGALSLSIAWLHSSPIIMVLSCLILAFVLAQFAFLGHDAGHGSLHRNKIINQAFGHLCMTVATGLAFEEWYKRHRSHHQFCQFEAKDPDMEVSVVVSLTEISKQDKNAFGLLMTSYQNIHIWFLSLFFAQSQRHLSQWGALKAPALFWKDLVVLIIHFALWWALPHFIFHVDGQRIAIVYILPLFFLGPYLAAIFWVNHIGMPLIKNIESFTFLEHQAITSRTVLNPKSMDWFFGGLNYQIEHHLYPQIPSFRLKSVQPIVQKEFIRQSLPYHGVSFWNAVREIARHFHQVAKGSTA